MKKQQTNKLTTHLFDSKSIFLDRRAENTTVSVDMENVRVPLFGSGLVRGNGLSQNGSSETLQREQSFLFSLSFPLGQVKHT